METQELTSQQQTEQTAKSYKATIEALDVLETALQELADRGVDIRDADRRQVSAAIRMNYDATGDAVRMAAQREEALDLFDDMDMSEVSDSSLVSVWLDQQLEIVAKGSKSLGSSDDWTTDAYEILLGYGGPSVRLTVYPGQAYGSLKVDWWNEHAAEMVHCPGISDYLESLDFS